MAVTVAFSPSVLLVDRLALDQALRANRQVCRMRTASSICQVQPTVSEGVGAVAGGIGGVVAGRQGDVETDGRLHLVRRTDDDRLAVVDDTSDTVIPAPAA